MNAVDKARRLERAFGDLADYLSDQPPTQDDLEAWASFYKLTTPVLGDSDDGYSAGAIHDGQYPFVEVIGRDMKATAIINPPTDENLRAAIEAAL